MKNDTVRQTLRISGMTCTMCALSVEKALKKTEGIVKARVDLANERGTIQYNPGEITPERMIQVIKDTGYGVAERTVTIRVGGMSCVSCARNVTDALEKTGGVVSATVQAGDGTAAVTFHPDIVSITDIKNAIETAGYRYLGTGDSVTDQDDETDRKRDLRKKMIRFTVGFATGIIIFFLMHFPVSLPIHRNYVMMLLAAPVFLYTGWPIFGGALRALRGRNLNMDVMYAMGIGVAFVSSIMGTFQFILSRDFLFYETAVLLASFLMLGRYLESRARGKTSEAIRKLMGLQPETATILVGEREEIIAVEDVRVNQAILVKPGDRIPVDGKVVDGKSTVDESMLTGEYMTVPKKRGDTVIGGTINVNGTLTFTAKKTGKDTMLSQIIKMVREAQSARPEIQKIADRVIGYFIPSILLIAIVTFAIWYILPGTSFHESLTRFIAILVVACPCALGLATPTAITVGLGRSAQLGVLIKNGEALETSEKVTAVLFDKTGTLTVGKPEVTDMIPVGITEKQLIRTAASIERYANHPLANAIQSKAKEMKQKNLKVSGLENLEGKGISGTIRGERILVGSRRLMSQNHGSLPPDLTARSRELEQSGKSVVWVSWGNTITGIIGISDTVRKHAGHTVQILSQNLRKRVIMMTGDNRKNAEIVAGNLGITEVFPKVLPGEKTGQIKKLQEAGEVVAFVGDGINDAPALAQADVGIAVGTGTDIAIESGDIVLLNDDIRGVVKALYLGRKVMSRIRQNLFWAFAYNMALIPLAAGILSPILHVSFRPEWAGLAMALSSVTVVSLSLLLKNYSPPDRMEPVGNGRENQIPGDKKIEVKNG